MKCDNIGLNFETPTYAEASNEYMDILDRLLDRHKAIPKLLSLLRRCGAKITHDGYESEMVVWARGISREE